MMWSPAVLFLLVGFAFASNNPGWTDNQEYIYKIRGRTLTGLMEVSDQYAGILFKAILRIQPRNEGQQLQALLTNTEYTQIHSVLSNSWKTNFPDEELSWKPLAMSQKPFQIKIENGKIVDLIVSKDVKNWEANMIKGIVSVFQLNVNGENVIHSSMNVLPTPQSNNAIFLAMEDTVSGETETLYEIRPVPEYLFDKSEQGKHFQEWKQNGDIIEVIKHKYYDIHRQLPAYSFGFGDYLIGGESGKTTMGDYISRDSTARAILLGNLRNYVVANSSITNTILVNPTVTDQQKAAVFSVIEAHLSEIKPQDEQIENISEPVELGDLVYTYNEPYEQNDQVQNKQSYHKRQQGQNFEDEENQFSGAYNRLRRPRSVDKYSRSQSSDDEYYYTQDQPDISEAPKTPLLPFTTGYEGKSIKKAGNIVKLAEKVAKKIGNELYDSDKDHHEKTLERFVNLASLIRLMNEEELKQLSEKLYTEAEEGTEQATWCALRDAVAESGTGPSFLVIQYWIDTDKIKFEEAAQVVSTMAKSNRQPTFQYMRSFFKLTKKEKVLRQWPLNDTALISFAHLVRSVYVDDKLSKSEYPQKAFGPYNTEEGKRFVSDEVIPYYSEMLKKSIQRAETHKIHAYIAVLGRIAHPEILAAYEPFLEGKQQCSQFQRLLMILSLEKLVEVHPDVALAVLYRVYQNPAEHSAVRIACVFHIMRSRPTTELLQAMAQYTNIEHNEYVNAVVKHTIEQLSELEDGDEFSIIRDSARAARPLLTKKTYGLNHGRNFLRGYIIDELNQHVKTSEEYIPSDDSYIPKGMRYTSRSSWAGLFHKEFNIQALVSSVDQLIDLAYKQTKNFKNEQKQQREHAQQQGDYPWSSQNIAKLLDMKSHEREQLEGYISMEFGAPYRMFGFDNNTMNQLQEVVQEWEQKWRNGEKINHYKLVHFKEMALGLPTVMGVPFVFHYVTPMLIKAQGEIMAVANPEFSHGRYLQQPDQIKFESEMRVTVSGKTQGRVMFVAPFERQQYISGYDKHWELNLPKIRTQMKVDFKQQELTVEIEPKQENKINILHYRTWPYTAKVDIMNFEPLTTQIAQKNVKIIETPNIQNYKTVVGKKSPGFAFEVEINHERKNVHIDLLRRVFSNNGFAAGLRELWEDGYIQNSQFDITYLPEQSTVNKITLRSKYDQDYLQNPEPRQGKWRLNEKAEPAQRQHELMKEVSAEIKNVQVFAWDNTIRFQGERDVQYVLTAAAAKSNVDPKSRVRICYKKSSDDHQVEDYEVHIVAANEAENTNAMDLEHTLQNEPEMKTEVEALFGESQGKLSKLSAKFEHRRSEERKRYLKDLPMYQECKQEMKQGNNALSACTKMNMIANLLDRADIKILHQNLDSDFKQAIQMLFDTGRVWALPNTEIESKQTGVQENEIQIKIKFDGDLESFNTTIQTAQEETIVSNIPVDELTRQIVVPHPVFHLRARLLSHLFGTDSYRDFCTVDQTKINTFSNKTYDAELSKQWTVMALYAPKEAREQGQYHPYSLQKQLEEQLENYVVLVRESKESDKQKDVKIVVSTPETDFQIVEIEMKAKQGKAQVSFNGKPVQVNKKESQDAYNGFVQIYALPNGEVKVEIADAFYVIFDGERVRMTVDNDKLKDATRGLCGQFNDQPAEDFLTSENCFARKPQKFVNSFEVEGERGQQIRQQFAGDDNQCVEKQEPLYINVITAQDARREASSGTQQRSNQGSCMFHQTKYVQQNGEICFTTVPLPSCKSNCHANRLRTKTVGVHCVQKSNVADLWKNQIDNTQISPDFSNKKQHKTIEMPVAESCSA